MKSDIPVKTELTVIAADDVSQMKLNWAVHERNGVEVLPLEDGAVALPNPLPDPITTREGLQPGMSILVPSFCGGYYKMVVQQDDSGGLYASNESLRALLSFGEDDRNCWACVGLINLRGLEKLDVTGARAAEILEQL